MSIPPASPPILEDRSYLAYLRPTPRPFYHFASGHIPPATRTHPHAHPCLAIHGCLQGQLILCTSHDEFALEAGMFCLIAPNHRHHWRNDGRATAATMGVQLDTSSLDHWPEEAGIKQCCHDLSSRIHGVHRLRTAGDQELHQSFWLAADHLTSERPRESLALTGSLLTLLGLVNERLSATTSTIVSNPAVAQQIRQLLLTRVRDQLTIAQIADELGYSPTKMKQDFRQAFGCGIMTYFNELKIWQSKRLLNDLSLTVDQVSRQLGFSSSSYFSRAFYKQAGETPTAYRHRNTSE